MVETLADKIGGFMSILLGIYLAGFLTTGSFGVGHCVGTGGNHAVSPAMCSVAMVAGAAIWPVTVPAMIISKD